MPFVIAPFWRDVLATLGMLACGTVLLVVIGFVCAAIAIQRYG